MKESIEIETITYFILMSATLLGALILIAVESLDHQPSAPAIRSYQTENPQ